MTERTTTNYIYNGTKAFRDPFGKIKSDSSIFFQAPEGVLQAPEVVL